MKTLLIALAAALCFSTGAQTLQPPEIAARSYLLFDVTSNQMLAEKDIDSPVEQASVIDYDEYGAPIRKRVDMKARQSQTRAQAQAAGLRYIECFPHSFHREPAIDRMAAMRTGACLSLSRLLYMPSSEETRRTLSIMCSSMVMSGSL